MRILRNADYVIECWILKVRNGDISIAADMWPSEIVNLDVNGDQ